MKSIGIIRNIDNGIAEIEVVGDGTACTSCSSGSCASCSASGKTRTYKAVNSLNLELSAGNPVEIELPAGKAVIAFIRVIVVPLILFYSCYFTADLIGISPAGYKVIAGFLGLSAGFAANFLLAGKLKMHEMPTITKILL